MQFIAVFNSAILLIGYIPAMVIFLKHRWPYFLFEYLAMAGQRVLSPGQDSGRDQVLAALHLIATVLPLTVHG